MKQEASILLVDDHPIFRQGLAAILRHEADLKVVAEAGDGNMAVEMIRKHAPDIVVMDISMPNLDGIEATRQITAEFPGTKIVALSVHSSKRFVRDMLKAGAAGYILKESVPEEMIDGIRTVLAGNVYLSTAISGVIVSDYKELLSDPEQPIESSVEPILHTKLHRPPVPTDIIPRVHLLNMLEEGRQRTMTLISAPAGYGKSSLASQWLEAGRFHSAWLSLDQGENDLRQFVRYLLEAIYTIFPTLPLQSTSLLQASALPPVKVVARYVINDLEQITEPAVLVLDDYHRISQTSVHELLTELLYYPSPFLHLVLLTRRDPSLPVSYLRAQGQLHEITTEHLRFSLSETRTFLERVLHLNIDEQTTSVLEEKIEGWVTGLRLAALSMGQERDSERLVKGLTDGSYYVRDYLIGEVLSQVPPTLARFLMETSLLDRFCAPLCDVFRSGQETQNNATEGLSGQMFIEWLEKTNLFVIPLDETHEWFRYHHLFQQLLQHQLKRQTSVEEIATLHIQASDWFVKHRLVDEAIHHALAAEDVERAVFIVEQHRQAILNEDRVYVLEKWLRLLPDTVKMQRPALLLAQAWVYDHQFKLSAILPLLDAVESLLEEAEFEDAPLHGEVDHFRGSCDFFQGEGARSLAYLTRALERIPFTHHLIRGEAEMMFSLASQMEGQPAEAVQTLEDVLSQQHALNNIRETRVLATLVFLKLIAAELDDTALLYTQRLYDITLKGRYDHAKAWSSYLRGFIYSSRNEQNAAIHHFSLAVEQRYILHRRAAIDSLVGLSLAYQLTQQPEQADVTLAMLFEFVRPFSDPAYLALAQSCQARLALMQGKPDAALRWVKTTTAPAAEVMIWWLEIPVVTYCRVLLAEGSETSLQDTEQRLQEYLQLNQEQHNICQRIDILALLSMVHKQQDRLDDALSVLDAAVTLAGPGGFIRPFVELGSPMVELLNQLSQQIDNEGYIEKILTSFNDEGTVTQPATSMFPDRTPSAHESVSLEGSGRQTVNSESPRKRPAAAGDLAWIVESLTDREIEVLELLNKRLYNKEIAEEMAIALETVKTHLRSIYQKLDAKGRRDAVIKARELGILSK